MTKYNLVKQILKYARQGAAKGCKYCPKIEKAIKVHHEAPLDRTFKTRFAAWAYLSQQGYISPRSKTLKKTKFYSDCKKGMVAVDPGGTVTQSALMDYIDKAGLIREGERTVDEVTGINYRAEKEKEELIKIQIQNERRKIELGVLKGKYILKDDLWLEFAGRIAILDAGLRTFFQATAAQIIDIVAGDPERQAELLVFQDQSLDKQMNIFAESKRFKMEIRKNA